MKITLKNLQNLRELYLRQGITNQDFVSMNIGYDGKIYFLFSSEIPPRIDGMFVDTVADAEYTMIAVTPSWETSAIEKEERISLGKHRMNFHFILPVPDGSFLLLGSRCRNSAKEGPEKNAVFTDREGNVLRSFTFGDGIADCIVRDDGTIITSYFDEGVFGNYGWDDPIGSCGVCTWNTAGENIWRADRDIADCYAMNIDAEGNLWYYYYTDFQLVRTDFRTETGYDPMVEGADSFAVTGNGSTLIMNGGYDDRGTYYLSRIGETPSEEKERLEFMREDGSVIPAVHVIFRGTKAIVLAGGGMACFMDFADL